jgi:hypothetical protein
MAFNYGNAQDLTPKRSMVLPYILPILIRRAKEGRLITYSELAEEIEREYGVAPGIGRMTWWGWPVGIVGSMVRDWGLRHGLIIPPINVIVINKGTKEPGIGADHVAAYFKVDGINMRRNRTAYMTAAAEAVYNFGKAKWDMVAAAAGTDILPVRHGKVDDSEPIPLPKIPSKFAPESRAHKTLKVWAAHHPDVFREYGKFSTGENEKVLSSGDRPDAYFFNGKDRLAVEVKASNADDDELKRGVYQCVKYRAVMRAENEARRLAPTTSAVLMSTRRPNKAVRLLMKRLHVNFIGAPLKAERFAIK